MKVRPAAITAILAFSPKCSARWLTIYWRPPGQERCRGMRARHWRPCSGVAPHRIVDGLAGAHFPLRVRRLCSGFPAWSVRSRTSRRDPECPASSAAPRAPSVRPVRVSTTATVSNRMSVSTQPVQLEPVPREVPLSGDDPPLDDSSDDEAPAEHGYAEDHPPTPAGRQSYPHPERCGNRPEVSRQL